MRVSDPISPRRYRRRILAFGAVALVCTFGVGAAIFVPVVQNDLEDRVGAELDGAGFGGIGVRFSGQDGTLTCEEPLDDPDGVQALASDVHGVRVIDLAPSCSDASQPVPAPSATAPVETVLTETEPTDVVASDTTPGSEVPPVTDPAVDGILDIVSGDPLFSQLAGVLATAGLEGADALGGDGPFTIFAPTDAAFDAAFDALGADAFEVLTSDPEMLRTVLLHHATDGAIESGDFVSGDLDMLDGTAITVDPDGIDGVTFTSNGAVSSVEDPATQLDIEASNGVVHAIDRLLIPEGIDLGAVTGAESTTSASLVDGQLTLSGVVATEEQRAALVARGQARLDPANIIDMLVVDPEAGIDAADFERLAAVVGSMPVNLVAGESSLTGGELTLIGTVVGDAAQAALSQLGSDHEAVLELSAREVAGVDTAAALQNELNDFVRDNPVLFEPNSATLTVEAGAIIDRIAARANRLDGTTITIVGHTDSDGNPATNQTLSERRAASVLEAVAVRGVDASTLASAGRGSTVPIVDQFGAEDKAASRRVEFLVEVT